ncbi:hypothetical protein E4P36_20935 [Streptomyces sp. 4R-3d]|nr:hypothetical protein E4P36_20935 [Streptomyces sp. 4R-3d]
MASLRRRLHQAAADAPGSSLLPTITTLRGHGYRLDPVQPGAGAEHDTSG